MNRRYFSQTGEDLLLWALFEGRTSGMFIDVGAFDGVHLSNSLSFEQQGWKGICVEAHPQYFPLCQRNRPGSRCVHAACVGPGHAPKVSILTEPLGLLSGIRADETAGMEERYAYRSMTFPGFVPVDVPAMTLDEILAQHPSSIPPIDFVSIDVEGTEIDVLKGFHSMARVILAEANTEAAREELCSYLSARGYHFGRAMEQNLFFASQERDALLLRDARGTGITEYTEHPLGAHATLSAHVGKTICLG